MSLEVRGDRTGKTWKTGALGPLPPVVADEDSAGGTAASVVAARHVGGIAEAVPPPRQLARGDVFIEGAPDELYDGLYAADAEEPEANGSRHYANGAGAHLFCTRSGEWCLKEVFDPTTTTARAFGPKSQGPEMEAASTDWRWWSSRWVTASLTVTVGEAAMERAAAAAAQAEGCEPPAPPLEADWGHLSKEIVMVVLHLSNTRSSQAMTCTCRPWRDAQAERRRRPSTTVGPISVDTHGSWLDRRRELYPHSFG